MLKHPVKTIIKAASKLAAVTESRLLTISTNIPMSTKSVGTTLLARGAVNILSGCPRTTKSRRWARRSRIFCQGPWTRRISPKRRGVSLDCKLWRLLGRLIPKTLRWYRLPNRRSVMVLPDRAKRRERVIFGSKGNGKRSRQPWIPHRLRQ